MGAGPSASANLTSSVERAKSRTGTCLAVSGRYHRLPKRIDDDYNIQKKVLGSGYNGSVFLATSNSNSFNYAVKGFKLIGLDGDQKKELESECEIFLSMDHPHVARLVDCYEDEKCLNLVMECMEGGELFTRVQKKKRFGEKESAETTYQMLLAVNYLHSLDIAHRDLKLENFLYDAKDSDHLKLIDFGFSHVWEPNTKMAASCGTLAYVAPEVLQQSYGSKCDLWSLGVVVFVLLSGYMPFSGSQDDQITKIKAGRYTFKETVWNRVSAVAWDFVKKLLVVDPSDRMSAEQALQHEWIANRGDHPESAVDSDTVQALCEFAKATAFKKACMSMMAWSLTNEERASVRQAFLEMDTKKTGVVSLQDLKDVLVKKYNINDEQVKGIFDALDTGGTHDVHYTEFLAAMVSTRIQMHDELLLQTFKRFDADNSGSITKENLTTVLGDTYDGKEIDQFIAEADTAGDGQISYQEFIAYCKGGGAADNHIEIADKLIGAELNNRGRPGNEGAEGEGKKIQLQAEHSMPLMQAHTCLASPRTEGSAGSAGTGSAGKQGKSSRSCAVL